MIEASKNVYFEEFFLMLIGRVNISNHARETEYYCCLVTLSLFCYTFVSVDFGKYFCSACYNLTPLTISDNGVLGAVSFRLLLFPRVDALT